MRADVSGKVESYRVRRAVVVRDMLASENDRAVLAELGRVDQRVNVQIGVRRALARLGPEPEGMRRCPRCGEAKAETGFGTRRAGKPQSWCRECRRGAAKASYAKRKGQGGDR